MKIKIVIIEDEILSRARLKRLLNNLEDDFEIIAEIETVKEGSAWFKHNSNSKIDLIFSDIQLTDGISFEIFESNKVKTPIIFTTAFDEYLLKAFKTYGIDYLLKPFSSNDIQNAIIKFKHLIKEVPETSNSANLALKQMLENYQLTRVPTFISYVRDKITPIKSDDIVLFSLQHAVVFAHTEGNKWLLAESLNQIEEKLPTHLFYRANRQFIIQRKFLKEIENCFGGKLKLKLTIDHEEILVSKDNCKHFKDWLQNG